MSCIVKVVDITNGKIKNVDVGDKSWMGWFDRMFVGVILMPQEIQELLDQVKDEGAICLAIERGIVKDPEKGFEWTKEPADQRL
jgi:cellulase/cellobiase CelA1